MTWLQSRLRSSHGIPWVLAQRAALWRLYGDVQLPLWKCYSYNRVYRKCCCPAPDGMERSTPYGAGCSKPEPSCLQAVTTLRTTSDPLQPTFQSCLQDSKGCLEALEGMQQLRIVVQKARAQILTSQTAHCSESGDRLAAAEPLSHCGDKVTTLIIMLMDSTYFSYLFHGR